MEQDMKLFYDIAFEAIKKEDLELRRLFTKTPNNEKLYNDEHRGICCLYETTFVYQIFKALMENNFKYRVGWEHPYKCNSNWHSDLALQEIKGESKETIALIEFKIWNTESSKPIQNDVKKLREEKEIANKYIFVIEYGGDLEEKLKNEISGIELLPKCKRSFNTQFRYGKDNIKENQINVYMYKV